MAAAPSSPVFKQLVYPGVEPINTGGAGGHPLPVVTFSQLAQRWASVLHFTQEPWAMNMATLTRDSAASGKAVKSMYM